MEIENSSIAELCDEYKNAACDEFNFHIIYDEEACTNFIGCNINKHNSSYRSPFSNMCFPQDDSITNNLNEETRNIEKELNLVFDKYSKM